LSVWFIIWCVHSFGCFAGYVVVLTHTHTHTHNTHRRWMGPQFIRLEDQVFEDLLSVLVDLRFRSSVMGVGAANSFVFASAAGDGEGCVSGSTFRALLRRATRLWVHRTGEGGGYVGSTCYGLRK
jgi:hypothetical protein